MKIEWTTKKLSQVTNTIELWLIKHHAYSGEMIMQDDDCIIDSPELISHLVDDIIKPTTDDEES